MRRSTPERSPRSSVFRRQGSLEAYSEAQRLGFRPKGLHAHIGAGVQDITPFVQVTEVLVSIAQDLESKLEIDLEFIDIGGGIGIPYRPGDQPMDLNDMAAQVTKKIREGTHAKTLVLEPGRYIIADTTVLLTRVVDIKDTGEKTYAGVDAGFNTLVRPAFYGFFHNVAVANKFSTPGSVLYDVVGPICESGIIWPRNVYYPSWTRGTSFPYTMLAPMVSP